VLEPKRNDDKEARPRGRASLYRKSRTAARLIYGAVK
jgi:hypothetical protein